MRLADTTLDPRAQFPFFFWHSSGGRFVNLIDDQPEYAEFVFMANPGTFEQDVRIVIGIGDGLGQVYRGVVYLKGNDSNASAASLAAFMGCASDGEGCDTCAIFAGMDMYDDFYGGSAFDQRNPDLVYIFEDFVPFVPFTPGGNIFTDVPSYFWARNYIHDMYQHGLIDGVGNNQFNPRGTTSIAHFLMLAMRLANVDVPPADGPGSSRPYVVFALNNGLFVTMPELHGQAVVLSTTWAHDNAITRELALYFTYRIFTEFSDGVWHRLLIGNQIGPDITFADIDMLDDNYFHAVVSLSRRAVVTGHTNPDPHAVGPLLFPYVEITRAEMTRLLFNMVTSYDSVFGGGERIIMRAREFPRLDPDRLTSVLRQYSIGTNGFSIFGAGQHVFTVPQNGVYIFHMGTPENPGETPALFRMIGTGPNMRFERVSPSWGSTNLFELTATRSYIVEVQGLSNRGYDVTVVRRGEYHIRINHYFDAGYEELHRNQEAVFDRIAGSDAVASRIFFERFGIVTDSQTPQIFTSPMDLCWIRRSFRYDDITIHSLCITPHPDVMGNFHVHNEECFPNRCGFREYCYEYMPRETTPGREHPSCSNALSFAWNLMGTTHGVNNIGRGNPGNIVVTWTGNATWFRVSDRDTRISYNRSFVWSRDGNPRGNIFMHTRAREPNWTAFTFVHEIVHIFGVGDHYHEWLVRPDADGNGGICRAGEFCAYHECAPNNDPNMIRPKWCIMGNPTQRPDMSTVAAFELLCDGCAQDVINFLANPANAQFIRRDS